MNLGNGWGLSEPLLRKLRLLEYFADNSRGSLIPGLPEWAQQPGTAEHADSIADLEDFDSRGWLDNFGQDFGGGANAQVNGRGYAFVEEVREQRRNKRARNAAARDAILHWLHDAYLDGVRSPQDDAFLLTPFGHWYGEPFPKEDASRATQWLEERGYIAGVKTAEGAVLRPMMKAEGITVVESGRSVNDPVPGGGGGINIGSLTGDGNAFMSSSPSATMSVTTHITDDHRQQAVQLADTVDQVRASLPAEAGAAADRVREAAASEQTDPGTLRTALLNLKAMLVGGSVDLIGKVIIGGSAGLLAHYGIPVS